MDLHITIRLWHLVGFLLALTALWRFESFFESAAESPPSHRRGHARPWRERDRRSVASSAAAFDSLATAPDSRVGYRPLPTPPSVVYSTAARTADVASKSTEALIGELHSRDYDWEVLAKAGLKFSSVRESELLQFLKRNSDKFRSLLEGTDLGLSAQSTMQLLRALSRRSDLAAALRETGLGAGADFQCAFDESPRDAGCQIRCGGGGSCARAEQKCKQIGHCVSLDVNRDRTWATLKSLQVYMPVPPPTCDGYAFHPNGSTPTSIAAPRAVEFDDLASAGGAPREDWCFRDTSVQQQSASGGTVSDPRNGNARSLPHAYSGNRRCTLETCFDLERCRPRKGDAPDAPLRLFIDTPTPKTYDMVRWPSCMRQCLREGIVESARDACLVVPTVNINCEWDVCDPSTHAMLKGMPSWERTGRNHIIWDYIDNPHVKYRTDDGLFLKTSMRLSEYRPGFDLPFPLLPNGEASHVTPAELAASVGRRTVLASFKGICQPSSRRPQLTQLHNGRTLIMLCTGKGAAATRASHYDYKTLMLTSVFSVAPAGNGLHSFRLAEAIFFGSIPVIVDDQIVLPFCSVLDWRRFSVRIRAEQIPQLPTILRAISPQTVAQMQARLAEVKRRYFLFPFNTALSLMQLRVREALRKKDQAALNASIVG